MRVFLNSPLNLSHAWPMTHQHLAGMQDFLFSLVNLGLREIFAQELDNHVIPVSEAIFRKRI